MHKGTGDRENHKMPFSSGCVPSLGKHLPRKVPIRVLGPPRSHQKVTVIQRVREGPHVAFPPHTSPLGPWLSGKCGSKRFCVCLVLKFKCQRSTHISPWTPFYGVGPGASGQPHPSCRGRMEARAPLTPSMCCPHCVCVSVQSRAGSPLSTADIGARSSPWGAVLGTGGV